MKRKQIMIEVKKFSAHWCSPYKVLNPMFERMKEKVDSNVKFSYIDVDEQSDIAQKYNVRSVPTVVIENNGTEVSRLIGLQQEIQYLNTINLTK